MSEEIKMLNKYRNEYKRNYNQPFSLFRVPVCVLLTHIACIFMYDLDSPTGLRKWSPILQALALHLLVLGVLQAVFAFFTILFICPMLSAVVLLCEYLEGKKTFFLMFICDLFLFN